MTKYDAILLVFVVLFAVLAGYFGYREWTDPILFPGGGEKDRTTDQAPVEAAPPPANPTESPGVAMPDAAAKPEPSPKPSPDTPEVDPEELRSSVEQALSKQVGQLAALMETRLASTLESSRDRIRDQSDRLQSADLVIRQAIQTYQENARPSVDGLSDTLGLINEMQNESESISTGLEAARAAWDDLFDDVTAIDQMSGDRLDEANFEFRTYAVSGAETLSEIASRLESEYNLPESDLSFLLNRFNEIEYRLYTPGGRRPAYRVVANESLRVPVPKTAGTILQDYALPEKLRSQIAHINQAASSNASLRKNLSSQVRKLKELEASVQAITAMTETLAQIDLGADSPLPDEADLSPELQDAWQAFESAASDYRSASGFEDEQLAAKALQAAINRLLKQYEQDYVEEADVAENPLDYYLRFVEKYRPGR